MDRNRSIIIWLYDRLAALYPPGFRRAFSTEQREVFLQALVEAGGPRERLRLLLREFMDLPGVLARGYAAAFWRGGWEVLLAGAGLLALFLFPVNDVLGSTLAGPVMGITLLVALLAAALLGFPRWGLPFAGFVLGIVTFFAGYAGGGAILLLIFAVVGRLVPLPWLQNPDRSMMPLAARVLYDGATSIVPVALLLVLAFLLFVLPRLRDPQRAARLPRRWRYTRRWSDISFVVYGAAIWYLLFTIDEYHFHGPVIFPAAVVMLLGAVVFLRAPAQGRGVAALAAALVLAFGIVAVGKYFIVPLQGAYWEGWFEHHPVETERWFESLRSVANLLVLLPALLLPALWKPWIEGPQPGPNLDAGRRAG